MMNPFPIQYLSLLAYALLRTIVGALLIVLGVSRQNTLHKNPGAPWHILALLSLVEIVTGAMLIAGFGTQYAALALFVYAVLSLIFFKKIGKYLPSRSTQILLVGISASLFITGAGAFAFDMPF